MLNIDYHNESCFNNIKIRVQDNKITSRKNSIKSIQIILRCLFAEGPHPLWFYLEVIIYS